MKALLLHARNSTSRYALLPLSALGTLILFGRNTFWIGIWPETGSAVAVSAYFISLLGAAASAWDSARPDVNGLRDQAASAAVRPASLEFYRVVGSWSWLLAAYALVGAIAFVFTAMHSSSSGIWFFAEYAAMGFSTVLMGAAWGWLVGRVLNPIVGSLVAAFSWFIFLSLVGQYADMAPVSGPPWIAVQDGAVIARVLAVIIFAASVCTVAASSTSQRRYRAGIALSLMTLLLVTVAMLGTTVLAPRSPVAQPLCVRGAMDYCLWPEHEKYVPLIKSVDSAVADLPGEVAIPERVVDYSLSGSTRWEGEVQIELRGDFPSEFDISEGSRWALARGIAAAITKSTLSGCASVAGSDDEHRWEQLSAWLEARLAGSRSPDYTTDAPPELQEAWAEGRRVAWELSESQQGAWATDLIRAYKEQHCSVP